MSGLTKQQEKLVADLEMEMMADMYNRMSTSCQKKCIPPRYKDAELTKGETVCIDRCVTKFMELHDLIGKKLTTMSQQDEEKMKQMQAQMTGQK
ncbi:TI10B-like protein [Mya arenaria]|uniref:Mitochondrial import inner membrane translocase subunit n=1 Tax=Mya arenaria TaxID=6604 RepID=A0ABY7DX32_MYAAR|nr:TI10B-like protein [Mya arenaria]